MISNIPVKKMISSLVYGFFNLEYYSAIMIESTDKGVDRFTNCSSAVETVSYIFSGG